MRMGVFYDGVWWQRTRREFALRYHLSDISFTGIQEAIRWWVSKDQDIPLEECIIVASHFVQGRKPDEPPTDFEHLLAVHGVVRHDARLDLMRKEKGADVLYALTAFEVSVEEELDLAVLMSGDADFVPLARKLRTWDTQTLIPKVNTGSSNVAGALLQAATFTPPLKEILDEAIADDYPLAPLNAEAPGEEGGEGWKRGTVTAPIDNSGDGIITDRWGRRWSFSRSAYAKGGRKLRRDMKVLFHGLAAPEPDTGRPRAVEVVLGL